ncbi:MAG TPA: kelch repeat-containing protein [Terriglobia bacterium]|nr:kelch repeat-containing protein [Terriglobia bacterium]
MKKNLLLVCTIFWVGIALAAQPQGIVHIPPNQWVQLLQDLEGGRPGSAIRYVPEADAFFLWGFMNANPDLLQEQPLMEVPEYDMVAFSPAEGRWSSHLPRSWDEAWSRKLPLAYSPRTYAGKTTGSERTVLRGATDEIEGAPRPDLNIVFDQVIYHPPSQSLVYFTGGLTAAYHIKNRRWSDLDPRHSPPPVVGGSLAYDSLHDEIVLFGGGHVAEPGPNGKLVGFTGTWVFRFQDQDWHRQETSVQPSPRMNTRMVCDTRNQVLVLFGGDGQSNYLADTWLYDLKSRLWRVSTASSGPEARAGHFTVYDPETGWVIVGGGYNRRDLTDMWAYDAAKDRWQRLKGETPVGFYLTADLAAQQRLILLVTSTRKPGDTMDCNVLFPVRTTYAYRLDRRTVVLEHSPTQPQTSLPKRPPTGATETTGAQESTRRQAQARRLASLPENKWVHLVDPARVAPTRTWGSATFDMDRGQILYWGGEHCGYEGNDVDAYDVAAHTWRSMDASPEYPERLWNHGVRLSGVTFQGKPWTVHGRKMYAYDPVSRKLIMVRPIRLTTGYDPEPLRLFPVVLTSEYQSFRDALVNPPSSYVKHVTWTYDPDSARWELLGPAPRGLDTLVTTRHGVMGVNVDWPSRLNDSGYLFPWSPTQPPEDKAIYLLDVAGKTWKRLSQGQPSPQNLYEQTSMAYDSKRDQIILHGAGQNRDELWIFEMTTKSWRQMKPGVLLPKGSAPPVCSRESVYIPDADVFLTCSPASAKQSLSEMWGYRIDTNSWYHVQIPFDLETDAIRHANENRAMVYDPQHGLVLLVLGGDGNEGKASVYALKYRNSFRPD